MQPEGDFPKATSVHSEVLCLPQPTGFDCQTPGDAAHFQWNSPLGWAHFGTPEEWKDCARNEVWRNPFIYFPIWNLQTPVAAGDAGKGALQIPLAGFFLSFVYGEKEKKRKKILFSCKCSTWITTALMYMLICPGWRPWGHFLFLPFPFPSPFLPFLFPLLSFSSPSLPFLPFPFLSFSSPFFFFPFPFLPLPFFSFFLIFLSFSFHFYPFFLSSPFSFASLSPLLLPFPLLPSFSLTPSPFSFPPTYFFLKKYPFITGIWEQPPQQEGTAPGGCMLCSTDVAESLHPPPPVDSRCPGECQDLSASSTNSSAAG